MSRTGVSNCKTKHDEAQWSISRRSMLCILASGTLPHLLRQVPLNDDLERFSVLADQALLCGTQASQALCVIVWICYIARLRRDGGINEGAHSVTLRERVIEVHHQHRSCTKLHALWV
jgi:hypothetical protein